MPQFEVTGQVESVGRSLDTKREYKGLVQNTVLVKLKAISWITTVGDAGRSKSYTSTIHCGKAPDPGHWKQ